MVNADVIPLAMQSLFWMFCDGLAGVTIYEDTQQLHIKEGRKGKNMSIVYLMELYLLNDI